MRVLSSASRLLYFGLDLAGRLTGARYPRFLTLPRRAKRAADQGQYERAAALAQELLALSVQYRHDWNHGNALHDGHLVLGRVAFAAHDLASARAELLLAGDTPGSPQLNSFGPNMSLARDLLLAGERNAVLEYFALCRRFWEMGTEHLDAWTADINQGREPKFGPNLAY